MGGDCSKVQEQLVDVVDISTATGQFSERSVVTGAFAALKSDGTVLCWGDRDTGGDCSAVQQDLKDVVDLLRQRWRFCRPHEAWQRGVLG